MYHLDGMFRDIMVMKLITLCKSLEQAVKDDVQWLKSSEYVPDDIKVSGWIYQVETGKVQEVVSA